MTFKEKILKDDFFSDENLMDYIKSFMINVRKGSMVHLHSIPVFLKLSDKIPSENRIKGKKMKEIEYNIAPPEDD